MNKKTLESLKQFKVSIIAIDYPIAVSAVGIVVAAVPTIAEPQETVVTSSTVVTLIAAVEVSTYAA